MKCPSRVRAKAVRSRRPERDTAVIVHVLHRVLRERGLISMERLKPSSDADQDIVFVPLVIEGEGVAQGHCFEGVSQKRQGRYYESARLPVLWLSSVSATSQSPDTIDASASPSSCSRPDGGTARTGTEDRRSTCSVTDPKNILR